MLSNAYFLAKFRFDTAENEPAKNLQKFVYFELFSLIFAQILMKFLRKSEKQKMEMKKENKYDTTRTVGNLQK